MTSLIMEVRTSEAPSLPIFSQAIKANGFIFCSGSIGLDSKTMKLVDGGVKAQTAKALENLSVVLKAAGSDFNKVLKANIYIKTFDEYAAMNEAYMEFFPGLKPARTCVAISDLPFGAAVEIECTAFADQ